MGRNIIIQERCSALKNKQTFAVKHIKNNIKKPRVFFVKVYKSVKSVLKNKTKFILNEKYFVRVNFCLVVNFVKKADNKVTVIETFYFQTKTKPISSSTNIKRFYKKHVSDAIVKKIDDFQTNKSDYELNGLVELVIYIEKCERRIIIQERASAFKKRIQTFAMLNNKSSFKDPRKFLRKTYKSILKIMSVILNEQFFVKVNFCLVANFVKKTGDKITEKKIFYIQTKTKPISNSTNLKKLYKAHVYSVVLSKIEEIQENGSNWILDGLVELLININKCEYLSGSSFISLPKEITDKKAVVNIVNKDNKCFKWALLSALYPEARNPNRVGKYRQHADKLNFNGIKFPVDLKVIKKFEELNSEISVNVYSYDHAFNNEMRARKINIFPVRLTKHKRQKHVNLLLIKVVAENETKKEMKARFGRALYSELGSSIGHSHYCWIKSLSRLIGSQINEHGHKTHICDVCLQVFSNETILKQHIYDCQSVNETKILLPDNSNKWMKFKNFQNQLKAPFIVYSDTEAILAPINISVENTDYYQKHRPSAIGYYVKCSYDDTKSYYESYTGLDCIEWFVNKLYSIAVNINNELSKNVSMIFTKEDEISFLGKKKCFICTKFFTMIDVKVRDHCHLTGKYRGAAHQQCNLNFQMRNVVPVVYHNLNYDSHFLIEQIATRYDGKVSIIPVNSEKYISFSKKISIFGEKKKSIEFRFIDSFRFLNYSLADLVANLPSDGFNILNSEFQQYTQNKRDMLKRKGVYPYDFMSNIDKMKIEHLPKKQHFFSKLTNSNISDEEYAFAKRVWKEFGIKNMQNYTELYLKTDIVLLADVFEQFRSVCLKIYSLDPAHYYTAPGLSWDAMLKTTGVRIELLTDIDQMLFVEKGIIFLYIK